MHTVSRAYTGGYREVRYWWALAFMTASWQRMSVTFIHDEKKGNHYAFSFFNTEIKLLEFALFCVVQASFKHTASTSWVLELLIWTISSLVFQKNTSNEFIRENWEFSEDNEFRVFYNNGTCNVDLVYAHLRRYGKWTLVLVYIIIFKWHMKIIFNYVLSSLKYL